MNKSSRLNDFSKQPNENSIKNLKDSEVGLFPSDWEIGRVKDYFTLGRGRVISKPYIRENSGSFPVYSSQSFNNGEMGRIDTYDFDGSYLTWTTDGAYAGSVFFREGKFNCTNVCGICLAKDPSVVNTKYAAFYLETQAKKHVSYVGNPKLMNNIFAEIPIVLPPLPEQKKIAEILSKIDLLIKHQEEKLKRLKQIPQSMFSDLLSKTKLRYMQLHEIANLERGKFSHRPRNDPNFFNGEYPYLQITQIPKDRLFVRTHKETLNKKGLSVSRLFKKGTLVISIIAQIGEVGILNYDACFPDNLVAIKPKKLSGSNSEYLLFVLRGMRDKIQNLAPQTAQKSINLEILKILEIPFPELPYQRQISEFLLRHEICIEKLEVKKQGC